MPKLYYIRHGETDWNVEHRLQGHHDTLLNARGRGQAAHCGDVLRDLFAADNRLPQECSYVSSPLRRARETMELVRTALDLDSEGYELDARLMEISFGAWEGLTLSEIAARDPAALARREQDKWGFVPPGGESYAMLTERVAAWYASLTGDTVVAAHGGVARGLIAHFQIMPPEQATHADILHGIVYVFANATMARYA